MYIFVQRAVSCRDRCHLRLRVSSCVTVYIYIYMCFYLYSESLVASRCPQCLRHHWRHLRGRVSSRVTVYMYVCSNVCMYVLMFTKRVVSWVTPPDPINYLCSLTSVCISQQYFTYRSVQIFKFLLQGLQAPGSDPPHKIMRYLIFPQHCWVVDFHLTKMVRRKCFVPGLYQLREGKSEGLALKRGKRRGFSARAAARHSHHATAHAEVFLQTKTCLQKIFKKSGWAGSTQFFFWILRKPTRPRFTLKSRFPTLKSRVTVHVYKASLYFISGVCVSVYLHVYHISCMNTQKCPVCPN